MSKRSFSTALAIALGTFVLIGIGIFIVVQKARAYPGNAKAGDGAEISVTIERGMTFPRIAKRLEQAGVISSARWFRYYAMHRGVTNKAKPGAYVMADNMTPKAVLDRLLVGVRATTVQVTIKEGINMLEVFDAIAAKGVASRWELEKLARDREFLTRLGIAAPTVDGYLFPDTYNFTVPTPARAVIERLVARHRAVWKEVAAANEGALAKVREAMSWTEHDVLIMASIVEKEAVVAIERPRIAQVFMNRLLSPKFVPHRLDTDPTIRYGCTVPIKKSAACQIWDPTQRLRRKQLDDVDNPYNTYRHEGLPPGPICNPGRAAIEATMNPDGSNFFFFVSRNDGTHVFSETRSQHRRAVDKYQR